MARLRFIDRQRPSGADIPLDIELDEVIAELDPGMVDWAPHIDRAVAERMWFTPPRAPVNLVAAEAVVVADATPISVMVDGRPRPGFSLGEGPLVVLAHGWGGRATQLGGLAVRLAQAGMRPVAIDLPGHGTDPQSTSDIRQMAAGLAAVADDFGRPAAVVAHSLGAMAAVLAFRGQPPRAAVFLAPFLVTDHAIEGFAIRMGLSSEATNQLRRAVQEVAGDLWPLINAGAAADLPGAELLLIHDPADREAPFEITAAMASRRPGTELLEAPGLGHAGMLQERAALESIAAFLVPRLERLRRAS